MSAPILFLDFAGPDDEELRDFYSTLFGWEFSGDSRAALSVASPLEIAVRKDPAEKRVYIGVPDVAKTLGEIEASGGHIDTPRFEVPGVVVLGLFRDPAGNPMGLVELDGDQPRVP